MQIAENKNTAPGNLYQAWCEIEDRIKSGAVANSDLVSRLALYLQQHCGMDFDSATFVAARLVAHARNLHKPRTDPVSPDVEAVQIEWISNGILVRGKNSYGPFCNYYRDTAHLITNGIGGRAIDFVKKKAPEVGDTCILYFGMSESVSE